MSGKIKFQNPNINKITIQDIWENINISTILLINLFDNNINIVNKDSKLNYPLLYLVSEYNLIQCYLDPDHILLHLLFDIDAIDDRNLTDSSLVNVIDLLINHDNFYYITVVDDVIHITLKIPKKYKNDILKISESKYSETSVLFKEQMRISYKSVPVINNIYIRYIVSKNLAHNIVYKKSFLENTMKTELNVSEIGDEFFPKFDPSREYYSEDKLK